MSLDIVILAAGQGKRMFSEVPKVLHELAGKPLIQHVVDCALILKPANLFVVYGHQGKLVQDRINNDAINWVRQAQQLGTGHAVKQVSSEVNSSHQVLVLYGDVPLIRAETLYELIKKSNELSGLALLTTELENPAGYGRIIRNESQMIQAIVEDRDANEKEVLVKEVNTGILACPARNLRHWLEKLDNNNQQGEYYLTDIVSMAVDDGIDVGAVLLSDAREAQGVNDKVQLASLERIYQSVTAAELLKSGVTLKDPGRIDVRGDLSCGRDVVIDVNCIFEGTVSLGNRVSIASNVVIRNATIGDDCVVLENTVIENSKIHEGCQVGPFARIRPESELLSGARVGNFVETKKSIIGTGSKVNHLSYVGDTTMGAGVNIGAGTITCNYDGAFKHQTVIKDNVFVGSDTQLIAPVCVGEGATIAAGSTITKNVNDNDLVLTRTAQKAVKGWKRPQKIDK